MFIFYVRAQKHPSSQQTPRFVAYHRVSTNKPSRSGLGLDARIMVVMAQHEREAISTRIKEALAVAKKRGNPHPDILKSNGAWQEQTLRYGDGVYPQVKSMRDRDLTLRENA